MEELTPSDKWFANAKKNIESGHYSFAVDSETEGGGLEKWVPRLDKARPHDAWGIAVRKLFLQQGAAQPVTHGRDSKYRQETVRKLANQAG